jgi:hypothetical protein
VGVKVRKILLAAARVHDQVDLVVSDLHQTSPPIKYLLKIKNPECVEI